jgi:acetate kinase
MTSMRKRLRLIKPSQTCILTINGGSSSIKFALFAPEFAIGWDSLESNSKKSEMRPMRTVFVIRTDEEFMIARTVCRVLGFQGGKEMCHEDKED